MTKVLIVSYYFAPQNAIGAVRPTKLAKYLQRMGYDVTVLCAHGLSAMRDPILERDLAELRDVRFVEERSLLHWWKTRGQGSTESNASSEQTTVHPSIKSKQKRPWLDTLYLWLADRNDRSFGRGCLRALKPDEHFDAVISTYGPLSVHNVARRIKASGKAARWIADFRDETAMPFAWQHRRLARYMRRIRENADAITSISAGCLRVMALENTGHVIHNGFDAEDLNGMCWNEKRTDRLCFVHCGQMYGAMRDLSPFFHALRELIDEGKIPQEKIGLIYAGKDTKGFVDQATSAGLQSSLIRYGFMPRDASLQLQRSAHVLLLAAWNLKDRQGNLPGKLLEYLMLGMPVLCCVSGDVPNSEAAALIRSTNVGFCYEQANAQEDFAKLKAYVLTLWQAFERKEPMPFAPDQNQINQFAYSGVADKFNRLLTDLLKQR